ncbi:hypothetical protein ACIBCM_26520 [Streptomyces sp. NPDC051018]|uniref:hypothetical protein n=1 Tax=Streptomyces sp. NPDC051018 TaxID=3365639 RepID=UPI0037891F0F
MTARLLDEDGAEPRIAYFTFCLSGLEDGADPQSAALAASPRARWTVLAGPGGAVFQSATTDHHPSVRLQQWSAEPPVPEGEWDTLDTVRFQLGAHGEIQLVERDGRPVCEVLDLGGPGTYRLRAASRHRAAAQERHTAGEMFFRGTEQWLIQIWPL